MSRSKTSLAGQVLEEQVDVTLSELCRVCGLHAEEILELIELGIIEPRGTERTRWRFTGICIQKARIATSLRRDLGVNFAGAALALDLLDELKALRARLRTLDWDYRPDV